MDVIQGCTEQEGMEEERDPDAVPDKYPTTLEPCNTG